jgi:hypothetical protein
MTILVSIHRITRAARLTIIPRPCGGAANQAAPRPASLDQ